MTAINTHQLANELGIRPRTVQKKCNDRIWPHMRVGRKITFSARQVEDIKRMVTRDRVEPRPEVDVPNPVYTPYAQVVPMRPDAA